MLALDAVLAVGDRHANNVLVQYLADERATLWVIDYDGSGLRDPESLVGVRGAMPTLGHITGLPVEVRRWADEASRVLRSRVDAHVLRELRAKTGALFPSVDVELAEHVLQTRMRDTSEIVSAHLDRVTS